MALNLYELATSREEERAVDSAGITLKWIALFSTDHAAVYVATLIVAPPSFEGYRRQKVRCEPQTGGVWMCTVEYGFSAETQTEDPEPPETPDESKPLGPDYAIDITAAQVHINQSKQTISRTSYSPNNPPNYQGAINVTRDRVEGTDVFAPKFEFTITVQRYPVLLPYLRLIRSLVATTNKNKWRGFEAGELIYLGMTGTCKPGEVWSLTHKFAVGTNLADFDVGQITVPSKKAWQFLWVTYTDAVDQALLVQKPYAAYVERVYDESDFNLIGIGN